MNSLEALQARLRRFASARNWEPVHSPKNLTTAVASEAGELAAILQWETSNADTGPFLPQLEDEIADVAIYLLRLCDVLDIDIVAAAHRKMDRNEARFPLGATHPPRP